MTDHLKHVLISQFEASLAMLNECVRKCPPEQWDNPIAKYPFWQVAYHTLYCLDIYLEPNEEQWLPSPRFHPQGMAEVESEYPSRQFTPAEIGDYLAFCLGRMRERVTAETAESLAGHCGVKRLPFSRVELHLYNIRHIMHHTGQLSAFLRKVDVDTGWVRAGWR